MQLIYDYFTNPNNAVEIFWGVIGLLSLIGTIYSLFRKPFGKFCYAKLHEIELLSNNAKYLSDLTIKYKEEEIIDGMVFFEVVIANIGNADIPLVSEEKNLTLKLQNNCKWLSAVIIATPSNALIKIDNDAIVTISQGVLRCNEIIRIQLIAAVPLSQDEQSTLIDKLNSSLKLEHRILNVRKSIKTKVIPIVESTMIFGILILYTTFMVFIYLNGSDEEIRIRSVRGVELPKVLVYPYQVSKNTIENVTVFVTTKDRLRISSNESNFEEIISIDDFNANIKGPLKLEYYNGGGRQIFLKLLISVLSVLTILAGISLYKSIRWKKILNQ